MTNDISAVLLDSAILLLVGMSVVFVFLTILIFAVHAIEWISNKIPGGEPVPQPAPAPVAAPLSTGAATGSVSPQVVAAITAAVHKHRNQRQ